MRIVLLILLCILSGLLGFFIGVSLAGLVEAGNNQMLAGSAIVLGYGVVGFVLGIIVALLFARLLQTNLLITLNVVFLILIGGFWFYYSSQYKKRKLKQQQENEQIMRPKQNKPTTEIPVPLNEKRPTAPATDNTNG